MENTFKTCQEAWNTLFLTPHKDIMAQRKALKAEFDKVMKEYKEKVAKLEEQDKANHEAWLKAQAELQTSRKEAKEAKAKEAAEKKEAKVEAKKAKTQPKEK